MTEMTWQTLSDDCGFSSIAAYPAQEDLTTQDYAGVRRDRG